MELGLVLPVKLGLHRRVGPSAYAALTETHAEEEPVTEPSKHTQLTAEVAAAELIPAGRPLTAEEIELLDDLAARLRAAFFGGRSEEIRNLLRRVSAVRPGSVTPVFPCRPNSHPP